MNTVYSLSSTTGRRDERPWERGWSISSVDNFWEGWSCDLRPAFLLAVRPHELLITAKVIFEHKYTVDVLECD